VCPQALITEGVLASVFTSPSSATATLGHIPVYIIGSALYGLAFAIGLYGYSKLRRWPKMVRVFLSTPLSDQRHYAHHVMAACLIALCFSQRSPNHPQRV
jgi:hypothetical protein